MEEGSQQLPACSAPLLSAYCTQPLIKSVARVISTGVSLSHSRSSDSGELGSGPQLDSIGPEVPCPSSQGPWVLLGYSQCSRGKRGGLFLLPLSHSSGLVVSHLDKKGFSGLLVLGAVVLSSGKCLSEGEFLV